MLSVGITLAVDNTIPSWSNQGQSLNHIPQGGSIVLYSQGFDNETGLRYAWLETNESGQWQNKSVFYLNSFNDSKTIRNVTFTGRENKTVWIRLPKNSNVLSATVKLRGYPYPNTTVNTTDDTSDWYGYYTTGGAVYVINPLNGNDSNWSSFAECAYVSYPQPVGYCHFMENYTTPSSAKGANIFVKAGCPKNCMIEDWYVQCWNWTSNNSWIRVGQSKTPYWSTGYVIGNVSANITPESFPDCWGPEIRSKTVTYDNIANYSGLYEPNNGTYWEGKVTWLDESYTNSPWLNVGEDTQLAFVDDDTSDWYGYYTTGGAVYVINESQYHNQNWNDNAECAYVSYPQPVGYCHFVENYTIPSYATGVNITVKAGCPKNCMITDWYAECWNWTSNNSWIRLGQSKTPHWSTGYVIGNISVNITPGSPFWECFSGNQVKTKVTTYDNIANYSGLYEPNNGTYWEGMVKWLNRLNLDSDYEWQYSGFYSGTQVMNDFSKEINDYLLHCVADSSGYCNVSLKFHSDTAGRIELSDLNVTYISGNYLKSLKAVKGQWLWSNFSWQNSSVPAGTTVAWRIHYQDGDVNRNATNIMTFKVKIPTNCSLTGLANHSYGITDKPLCTCDGDGATHLHLNGTLRDDLNNTDTLFGAWIFSWVCNMTEGANYANASKSIYQTINKTTSPLVLTNNTSWTINYPSATNIMGEGCPSQLGCAFYRDNNPMNIRSVFNNASQASWNETLKGLENRTFWVNLPKNDYIRSVKMSLTGFYVPSNTTLSKSTSGERTMWMEYDGTYLWVSGNYSGRTYKHKPDEAPSTYYNFQGPIVYDGTYLWTQNWNGGNITKRDYSNPNTILGQFMPPDNCYGNTSRGMTWGITWMGPQGSPSTNVGNHLIYYCDVNNTTAEPIYWLNETKGLEQGYCNSTNGCILKTCGPGYNIINDLTFDKTTNRLYGVFDLNAGGVGIFKLTVDNTQGYCPAGPSYTSIYPENISTNSGLALKRTDLVWYGTGNLIDTDSEFEKYYLINLYNTYPSNILIDVANDGDIQWNYMATLSSKVQTSELGVDAVSYLSSCTPKPDGTCDVPFVLHSDAQGIVQISDILMINNTATDSNLFGADTYVYNFNTSGNENYTSNSTTNILTINKGNANVIVYPGNQIIKHGTSISQYCTDNAPNLDCKIYRNDNEIANNTNEVLPVGTYNYVANITDTVNYTNYQSTSTLTVANCTSDSDCDDYIECTDNVCVNPGTINSYCSYPNSAQGTSCDDGLYCTVNDSCTSGVCGGSSRDCSDSYSCTDDSCDETNDLCLNILNDANCAFPEVCRPLFFPPPTGCGILTSCTNKTDGTPCDDGLYCNGPDECQSQNCISIGPSIDCSSNNLQEVSTCDYIPDNYHPTLDFRYPFTSQCQETGNSAGYCTLGNETLSHTCDQATCGAECDLNNSCANGETCNLNSCVCEDLSMPIVTITSPMNDSYFKEKTWLNFTVNEPTFWVGYSLDSQPNKTIVYNDTLNLTDGSHNVIAYANDTSGNMGASDKTYFFYCKGDINKDKIIDIFDIVAISIAYSSMPGDPNWNANADLNDDNIIDIFDLVTVAINFGKNCQV